VKQFNRLLGVMVALSMLVVCKIASADDVLTPFVDAQTDAIVHADLSKLDMDALTAFAQRLIDKSSIPDNQKAQTSQQMQASMAQSKKWVADFKAAGGKDIYVVVNVAGVMTGDPGAVIAPIGAGADPAALAKILNPTAGQNAVPGAANAPTTAVIGQNLVMGIPARLDKYKNPAPADANAPHIDLLDAMATGSDSAIQIAVGARGMTMATQMTGMQGMAGPGSPLAGVTWLAIALNAPPTESFNLTMQTKDAATATAMSDSMNQKIEAMKTDPQAKAALGDNVGKFADALKPTTDGTKVSVGMKTDDIETLVVPILLEHMAAPSVQTAPPAGPGAAPAPGGL
jgi:3-methyladenine DNA glycosylase Tag